MKISCVRIENFRSIENTVVNTTDFNICVGQNNCGKTNFFEAIEFFFNGIGRTVNLNDLRFNRQADREILVELSFTGALHGAEQMRNAGNRTKIVNVLNGNDSVTVSRSSTNPNKRKVFVSGMEVNPAAGFDAALNDFLPKFEYISTKQYHDSVSKYAKSTPIGIMLSGVLTTMLEGNQQYQQFQQKFKELFEDNNSEIKVEFDKVGNQVKTHLERQFPDCTKVKFEVSAPIFDDLLKNFETTVDDGVETSAEEKGDGMQRALMLSIIQAYADYRKLNEDFGKSFVFFIDEAELHLHPTAQRNLKNVLHLLSGHTDQVFINTHSSVFVAEDHPQQTIFRAEKNSGATSFQTVSAIEKPYVIFELLGGNPSDLLLPRNFLIVEGQSEFEVLTRVIERFYLNKPPIQIMKADGDIYQVARSINAIEKAFMPLRDSIYKDRIVILIDHPSSQTKQGVSNFLERNIHLKKNNQFFQLGARDIEQCYPDQSDLTYGNWRKTQSELDAEKPNGEKIINGKKKKQLAKHVGVNISQEQFETSLIICHQALQRSWELAF